MPATTIVPAVIQTFLAATTAAAGRAVLDAASTAQGALAATAVQPADLPTDYEIASAEGRRLIAALQVTWYQNSGTCYFATTKATAGTITVKTTTGYARLILPDGTLGTQSPLTGLGASGTTITLTIPAGGGHRAYGVVSVGGGGTSREGNMTVLYCSSNQLTALNVSSNTALTGLYCSSNQLTALDVSSNTALTQIDCSSNQLTTIAVNTILSDLDAHDIDGYEIDLSGGPNATPTAGPPDGTTAAANLIADGWESVTTN